jgi:stage II sporulation protein D
MTADELSERINENLLHRQNANPAMIHMLDENGNTTNSPAKTIGTLQRMEVTRRGQGGNIMEMIFHGTLASARVQTEFNIRALLNPHEIPVMRHDNSTASSLNLLPSAFFTMEAYTCPLTGQLQHITFYGGGNGHGVGMSQNGVRALLDMGLTYIEILRHFYPGTKISPLAI